MNLGTLYSPATHPESPFAVNVPNPTGTVNCGFACHTVVKDKDYAVAIPHNTSIEYFPAPVTHNNKRPPIMLRFL